MVYKPVEGQRVLVLHQEELLLLHHLFIHGWSVWIQILRQEDKMKGVEAIPCPCHLVLPVVRLPCLMEELVYLPKTHIYQNGRKEGSLGGVPLGMFTLDLTGNCKSFICKNYFDLRVSDTSIWINFIYPQGFPFLGKSNDALVVLPFNLSWLDNWILCCFPTSVEDLDAWHSRIRLLALNGPFGSR